MSHTKKVVLIFDLCFQLYFLLIFFAQNTLNLPIQIHHDNHPDSKDYLLGKFLHSILQLYRLWNYTMDARKG